MDLSNKIGKDLVEELIVKKIEDNRVGIKIATNHLNGWKKAVIGGEQTIQTLQNEICYLESELCERRVKQLNREVL